jgi:hypothetical protein
VLVTTEDIKEKLPELERWDDCMILALLYHESARNILNLSLPPCLSLFLTPFWPPSITYPRIWRIKSSLKWYIQPWQ